LLHWSSALIAMPAIAYAGRPFFLSAIAALRHMRTNMDVPISVGVILVTGISLAQTIQGGAHTYFESSVTLLFFLLVGRVLDHRVRGQARATAEQLLTLRASDVAVLQPDGSTVRRSQHAIATGDPFWWRWASGSGPMASWSAEARRWTPAWSPAKACRSMQHRV
jgi:Cu2+-exporting ATPase